MKKIAILMMVLAAALMVISACAKKEQESRGEALFKQHCSPCHPGGGNVVHPDKTLEKKVREGNGVKTAEDVMGKMRNPGPGMTKFDEKTIPDADARQIAEYVVKTF